MLYTTSVSYRWISCFTFMLLIHKVSVQSVRVEGVIGQTVTLSCSVNSKVPDVFWRDSDGRTVCDVIGGKADYADQDSAYKSRVKCETKNGNFSMMLSNLMKSDEGTYTCYDPNIVTPSVELTVIERSVTTEKQETHITTQKERNQNTTGSTGKRNGDLMRQADSQLTFLLVLALIYSFVF